MEFDNPNRPIEDYEYPDEDSSDELADASVQCPECRAWIYEDTPQCPHCGHYVTSDNRVLIGKPFWYIFLALVGIIAVILVLSIK